MRFSLDEDGQQLASQLPVAISQALIASLNQDDGRVQIRLLLKVLANFLEQPMPYLSGKLLSALLEDEISENELKRQLEAIFEHLVTVGANTTSKSGSLDI